MYFILASVSCFSSGSSISLCFGDAQYYTLAHMLTYTPLHIGLTSNQGAQLTYTTTHTHIPHILKHTHTHTPSLLTHTYTSLTLTLTLTLSHTPTH